MDHSKTGHFGRHLVWTIWISNHSKTGPFVNWFTFDYSKTGHADYRIPTVLHLSIIVNLADEMQKITWRRICVIRSLYVFQKDFSQSWFFKSFDAMRSVLTCHFWGHVLVLFEVNACKIKTITRGPEVKNQNKKTWTNNNKPGRGPGLSMRQKR